MPELHVIMYHYVRDFARSRFSRIKGMSVDDFRAQVRDLSADYEMATLESALAFLSGAYNPHRDLCLLTFDDGLAEHYSEVLPILKDRGCEALFFLITACVETGHVAPVHMNHFLMASLPFRDYSQEFLHELREFGPGCPALDVVDLEVARRSYRWDTTEVAVFKYFFNFLVDPSNRDRIVKKLFTRHLGDEQAFASELYLNWDEVREMQRSGMIIGGHSHNHLPLATLTPYEFRTDLETCRWILLQRLEEQMLLPFCFPYGKRDSYNSDALQLLERLNFCCAFTTESGANLAGADLYQLRRVDCKQAPCQSVGTVSGAERARN